MGKLYRLDSQRQVSTRQEKDQEKDAGQNAAASPVEADSGAPPLGIYYIDCALIFLAAVSFLFMVTVQLYMFMNR